MKKNISLFALLFSFMAFGSPKKIVNDTIISAGKPTIVVISIFDKDNKAADPFFGKREYEELKNNFPEYNILLVDEPANIVFETKNKDFIFAGNPKLTYELVAFWDGKKDSPVKINKIRVKLTEYISSLTGQNKQSSYLAANDKILADYNAKKLLFNPNENSKFLAQYYIITLLFNGKVYGSEDLIEPQDYSKVKSVSVYMQSTDGPNELAFVMNFNPKHLVSDILYAKRGDSEDTAFMTFSYDDNNLLKKLVMNDNFDNNPKSTVYTYGYDKDKLIEISEDQYSVYSNQHKMLVMDDHFEFKDIETDFRISSSREEINDGCKVFYEDGSVVKTRCFSDLDRNLPYPYQSNLYENEDSGQSADMKIEKNTAGNISVFAFLDTINDYKEVAEITIGEDGLTKQIKTHSAGQFYTLNFEYKY
ncbi:MAG TPA: hypothetical protein PKN96_07455 [Flavobacterium sp.]|uniref:hypothetical protein n=1 Tax=Flavobacterium sp. TaxID=239 RepID=UPI002C7D00FB|nr:hypothetical protein [Flavobacterium sp.]HNP33113.1 hypothetical protein [Flavobacterium sp.]